MHETLHRFKTAIIIFQKPHPYANLVSDHSQSEAEDFDPIVRISTHHDKTTRLKGNIQRRKTNNRHNLAEKLLLIRTCPENRAKRKRMC